MTWKFKLSAMIRIFKVSAMTRMYSRYLDELDDLYCYIERCKNLVENVLLQIEVNYNIQFMSK